MPAPFSLSKVRNRWAEKEALIHKVRAFLNKSSRPGYPQRLELTPDEKVMAGTSVSIRDDLTPNRAKLLLQKKKFTYNPTRWYELVWPDKNEPPVLLITNFYCQPLLITETRIVGNKHTDKKLYAYEAREFHLIVDKMMTPII